MTGWWLVVYLNGFVCSNPVKTQKTEEKLGKEIAYESTERVKHSRMERAASKKYDQVWEMTWLPILTV